jgi:hypothetical protein
MMIVSDGQEKFARTGADIKTKSNTVRTALPFIFGFTPELVLIPFRISSG